MANRLAKMLGINVGNPVLETLQALSNFVVSPADAAMVATPQVPPVMVTPPAPMPIQQTVTPPQNLRLGDLVTRIDPTLLGGIQTQTAPELQTGIDLQSMGIGEFEPEERAINAPMFSGNEEIEGTFFHVTPTENIESIKSKGLLPGGGGIGAKNPGQFFETDMTGNFLHLAEEPARRDFDDINEFSDDGEGAQLLRIRIPPEQRKNLRESNEGDPVFISNIPPEFIEFYTGTIKNDGFEPLVQKDEAESVISYVTPEGEKVFTKLTKDELGKVFDEVKEIPEGGEGKSQIHLDANTANLRRIGREISREDFMAGHPDAPRLFKKMTRKAK